VHTNNNPAGPTGASSSDPGAVQRGTPRWALHWAMVVLGAVLAFSVAIPWAEVRGDVAVTGGGVPLRLHVSGLGDASIAVDTGLGSAADRFVATSAEEAFESAGGAPGGFALALGILAVIAGLAYGRTRYRGMAAIATGVAGVGGLIGSLWVLTNAEGMYADVYMVASVSPGIGAIAALVLSLLLTGCAVIAMVFERQVAVALAQPGGPAGPSAFHFARTQAPPAERQPRVPGTPAIVMYRLVAFIVDLVLVSIVTALLASLVFTLIDQAGEGVEATVAELLVRTVAATVPFAYFSLMEERFGKTIGKRILGLAVIGPHGYAPTADQARRRNLFMLLGLLTVVGSGISLVNSNVGAVVEIGPPLIGVIVVLWLGLSVTANPARQGIHDRFAGGTRVINLPSSNPVPRVPNVEASGIGPWIIVAATVLALAIVLAVVPGLAQNDERDASASVAANRGANGADPFDYPRLDAGACASPGYPGDSVCKISAPSGDFLCSISAAAANCVSPAGEPLVEGVRVPLAGSGGSRIVEANLISVDAQGSTSLGAITAGVNKITRESAVSSSFPYDHQITAHGFTCAIDRVGVTCRHDATASGFFVSRQRYEFF